MIELKGMTFDHDIFYSFSFSSSLFLLGGKGKGEENNQSVGQKSCLSARSVVIKYNCTSKWWKLFGAHIALAQERGQLCTQNSNANLFI